MRTDPMDHEAILNTLLHELKDGVLVCDPDAQITLFNQAAEDLFGQSQSFGKGKSLYTFCFQPPVEHALNLLTYQYECNNQSLPFPYVQFMNASRNQEQFFRCRVSFLPPLTAQKKSFVIIFEDISAWHIPDNPLYMKIEEFRAPMTNLRAAVENLTEYPEMSPVMHSAFENVLVQESINLTEAFNTLAGSCRVIMQTQNLLTELNSVVLFGYVARHLQNKKISVVVSPEQSIGTKVDIYGLLLVLDYLASSIKHKQKGIRLSCEIHIGKQFIYFDFVWSGPFIPPAAVEKMLAKKLEHSIGAMTVAAILNSMGGDIWSQQQEKAQSTLRLALPITIKAGNEP
ncbi:MAG: PAS domain-containing protein [Desulfobulbales bacterium]